MIQVETRDQRFECVQITQTHDGAYRLRDQSGRETTVLGHAIKSIVNIGSGLNKKSIGTATGALGDAEVSGIPMSSPGQCPTCGRY